MTSTTTKNRLRVLIVAPSLDILGGQSRQAVRLMEGLKREPDLEIGFLPHNPRLPGILRKLQSFKYVRTVLTTLYCVMLMLWRVRKYDIMGAFRRLQNHLRGTPTANPKLVSYLAAGSIKGLRPLRYEKRIARNRFIFLSIFFALILWGVVIAMLKGR